MPVGLHVDSDSKESQKIVDRYGRLIRVYRNVGDTSTLKLTNVPSLLIDLVVSAEDKRFFSHGGVDLKALGRAFYQNLKGLRRVSGASTITQQVVRMAYGYRRSILSKPLVMLHAFKVDRSYTKGEILEYYLNSIPYTFKVKGIVQGAEYYFGKDIDMLSPAELATLVVLIRAPSRYSSLKRQERLLKIRNQLLDEVNLSAHLKELSKKEEWYFKKIRHKSTSPHFVRTLMKSGPSEKIVKTTLDLALQEEVQKIVSQKMQGLKSKGVHAASVLILDNKDGSILSYIGNHDFFSKEGGEYDGILLKRQPGSTMKAFTYALALENGFTAGSSLKDEKMYFQAGSGSFKPRNYSNNYTGLRTLRDSLANSLNIPSLYLADKLGVEKLYNYIQSFGLSFDKPSDFYGVGLTLGNAEISLLELTSAYTAFPNKGVAVKPKFLLREKTKVKRTLMKEQTAELITDILSDSLARSEAFGRYSALDTKVPSAGKTGTSTLYRDNWVIGYTPRYTVGVWVGNMDQKEMKNVSGITGAGPIYQAVVNATSKFYHSGAFVSTHNYDKAQICSKSGGIATEQCPHSYTEKYVKGTAPKHDCKLHSRVLLTENDKEPFKILSPVSGAIYAVDPNIPRELQKIDFKTSHKENIKEISWFRNSERIATLNSLEELKWQLEKGKHKLKAEVIFQNGKKDSDTIYLNVL